MTELIFSFDTEDFTSNRAADAIYREAKIFEEEGVRGCFCIVGLLADQLVSWSRTDVLEALSHHEINTHSYGHSLHPVVDEYTDIENACEAIDRVVAQERLCLEKIRKATGAQRICAAVLGGNQNSYAAKYAYHKLGLPIYAGSHCDTADGEGTYYCNIYNIAYVASMEGSFFDGDEADIAKLLDRMATRKRAVIYTHPNMAVCKEWWDKLNYEKENPKQFGSFLQSPEHPMEVSERFYGNIRRLLRMVKADPRFKITTYGEVADRLQKEGARVVKHGDIPVIAAHLSASFENIRTPVSLSISDVMLACCDLLQGKAEHVCGDVYGFLDTPYAIEAPVTLCAADIRASAQHIKDDTFLPTAIKVGGIDIGPADWLFAALEVLMGKESVTLTPREQLPSLAVIPNVQKGYKGRWKGTWMYSDSFEDAYLSERLRLQIWTLRFANL